ncbi:MAG: hypothetical protein KGI38_05840 [Thaumarchaeota archaeon]|nr:hypothetical protein [Nitrososphaerota archaeon]
MGIRSGFRTLVIGYRRTARIVVVVFIILSLFMPLIALGASSTPTSFGITVTTFHCYSQVTLLQGRYWLGEELTITGPPAVSAPLLLEESVTWYDANNQPFLTAGPGHADVPSFTPGNTVAKGTEIDWEGSTINESIWFPIYINSINQYGYGKPTSYSCSGWVALYSSVTNSLIYNGTIFTGTNSATFQLLAALPEFNDTSFGATAHCPTTLSPCQIPVGNFYNFIAGISLGLAVLGFMLSYASSSMRGKDRIPVVDLMITILFIVAFPYIYNEVATLVNYLNMALVSGPGNDYTSYAAKINQVWAATGATTQGGLWGFLSNPLVQLAAWVVDFIVYIGSFILGTIRVLLIAVMVVAFPISLALKEVPFTRKLGQMVEDTLFGLILASIMSSIVLGLAASILGTGTNGTVFQGSDVWFAAISLMAALMLPTVFAPLTGVMFQTGMQAAMAAGTAAVLAGSGGTMGAVGGIQSMGQMANTAGGLAGTVGKSSGSIGTSLASSMQHGSGGSLGFGVLQGLKGVGAGLAMGTFYGMGMKPVAYFARGGMRSPGQIVREHTHSLQQAAQAMQFAQMQQEAEVVAPDLVKHAGSVIYGGLSGNPMDFSYVTNSSGQHFRTTNWTNPTTGSDYGAASKWRDQMLDLSLNRAKLGQELASHKLVPPEMAKNDLLMDSVGRQLHDRISAIDPKTDAGVVALQNLKNTIDANQFRFS